MHISDNDLDSIQSYDTPFNLYDCFVPFRRKIGTTVLDENADTYSDFLQFASALSEVDELILVNEHRKTDNPIIEGYSEATMQAYLYLFRQNGINAFAALRNSRKIP